MPESYNKISTWHWAERDAYNKLWYDEVSYAYKSFQLNTEAPFYFPVSFQKAKIDFYIYFPFKHRRDKLNYALGLKPALDQIAKEGIIVDDNWERIDDNYYSRIDKKYPRTKIIIKEIRAKLKGA